MKHKKIYMMLLALILPVILTGCQLALEEDIHSYQQDLMVGMFVTTEYLELFDMDAWLEDNINQIIDGGEINVGTDPRYQNRLYATVTKGTMIDEVTGETVEDWSVEFDSLEGIAFFKAEIRDEETDSEFTMSVNSEGIGDCHTAYFMDDAGERVEMEGTIYVAPGSVEAFYANPVYQSADGSIYLTAGDGIAFVQDSEREGERTSLTYEDTTTETRNGETTQHSSSVKLSISMLYPPTKIVVLQMNADSQILSREEYIPNEMPDTLAPQPETAYVVVESHKQNDVSRALYSQKDNYIETFWGREDGICIPQSIALEWPVEKKAPLSFEPESGDEVGSIQFFYR